MSKIIIADSCCDTSPSLKEELGLVTAPLTMTLGQEEFIDDSSLDQSAFMERIKTYSGRVGSAAPSPFSYQKAIESTGGDYIITLSSKLSASYENARLGSEQASGSTGHGAHVFDSKSASAGETLVAIKLHELIAEAMPREQIISKVHSFIDTMRTYFVLENYDNLQKNGRLGKIASSLIKALNIKLIMGGDGDGDIALHGKARGEKRMIDHLMSLIEKSGKRLEEENLVLAHCNNLRLAESLSSKIREHFQCKKIHIVPTGGLSSLYADDKGVILAF